MDIKRIRRSQDNKLLDEIIIDECELSILKSDKSRYDLTMKSMEADNKVTLCTTKQGQIDVRIEKSDKACFQYSVDSIGNLEKLLCDCKSMHLEQMDRGYYWLGIDNIEDRFSIHFTTNGYLKALFETSSKKINPGRG